MSREVSYPRDLMYHARGDHSYSQMDIDKRPAKGQPPTAGIWLIGLGLVLGCAATVVTMSSLREKDKLFVDSL